jgi:hypothetical protein
MFHFKNFIRAIGGVAGAGGPPTDFSEREPAEELPALRK